MANGNGEETPVADFVRERFYLLLVAGLLILFSIMHFILIFYRNSSDQVVVGIIWALIGSFGTLLKTNSSSKTEIRSSNIKNLTTDKGEEGNVSKI